MVKMDAVPTLHRLEHPSQMFVSAQAAIKQRDLLQWFVRSTPRLWSLQALTMLSGGRLQVSAASIHLRLQKFLYKEVLCRLPIPYGNFHRTPCDVVRPPGYTSGGFLQLHCPGHTRMLPAV